eukprot:CAMPEP_0182423416 /NCGR_PEP_ID=MMETSP1167-20130531/9402_1 /TAXON_ID=2988 /ORGANISM="Mallomonas Sp, Strain CCMP3275" /LENGTH=142 /DNA_ID=CAMNT_0024602369 /DNA_START=118 /DNA_END=543 /DNA_ORIENTATION=-
MAALLHTEPHIRYIFLLQDDDVPPLSCQWIHSATQVMARLPAVGLLGLHVAEVYGSAESRTKTAGTCLYGEDAPSHHPHQTDLSSDRIAAISQEPIRMQFAATVDLGPMVVRRDLFHQLEGFDTSISSRGQPGIGLDFDLAW